MTELQLAAALLDAALRGAAIALLLLIALRIRRDSAPVTPSTPATARARSAARLLTLFTLALCIQIVSSTPLFERSLSSTWQALPVGISVGNSVLFWLFVQLLFDDDFELRRWHALPWLFMFASGLTFALSFGEGTPATTVHLVTQALIRWLPLLFAVLTMVAAVRRWSADLVESRRQLRAFVVVAGCVYTAVMVALRLNAGHGMLAAPAALVDIAFLLVIVAVPTVAVVRLRPGELFAPASTPAGTAVPAPVQADADTTSDPQEQPLLANLHALMADQRAYAQENLTVASLAQQLKVPEYRLRRAINRSLGHRNFNAYVNEFRLRETQAALRDPLQSHLPILTIALTAGFQSIGPFNRAFKALTGQTPSEYRQQSTSPTAQADK
ncbi:helix-turn-helix domain-containing protein [Casimicrobium huifangae]|uniref:helix-turn-helix domain-containing protein n=1 Tax=Casimicrobium huifangae TaxID=2591109 RepID=UPI0037851943